MAINVGYEILVDSSVSADTKADIAKNVIAALSSETLSIAYATTYAVGTSTTNQASFAVGGASPNMGIRVIMDSAVVGTNVVARILKRMINLLDGQTIVLSHAVSYVAGTRTYNLTVTVT